MRRKQLGISPAKIAMAVAVTIEAIAGTGGMKNVTGTRSAVAMVAVSPGRAPTKGPKSAEAKMTQSTYGSNTSPNAAMTFAMRLEREALQHAPRQGNAQQLVEGEMDQDRREDRDRHRDRRPGAEHQGPPEQEDEASDMEPERVGEHDIEREPEQHADEAGHRPPARHPAVERDPGGARSRAADHGQHAAGREADGDEAPEKRRAVLLPGHRRVALYLPEHGEPEKEQRRARQGIVDFQKTTSRCPRISSRRPGRRPISP